jgi:2-polyprenyl-3-methyl-5-hydroxy-6-metoxy-1,4-benzoquinol methylase
VSKREHEVLRACPQCVGASVRLRYVAGPFHVVRCQSCGLTFLGNPPDEARLYEAYHRGTLEGDAPAAAYAPDVEDAALATLYAINEQRIARVRKAVPSGRLLDVGCGRGYFLETARRHGYAVRGIDISERAAAFARRTFGVAATTETPQELWVRGERYDLITLWHVLEHFADPLPALRMLHGLLADGGACFIEVPNLNSLKFRLARRKWTGGNHPRYHRTFFTRRTLRHMLEAAGFAPVHRLQLSYRLPDQSTAYTAAKRVLNVAALDAFLDFVAWKGTVAAGEAPKQPRSMLAAHEWDTGT